MDLKTFLEQKCFKLVPLGNGIETHVRPLSIAETDQIHAECKGIDDVEQRNRQVAYRMLLACVCDGEGKAIFAGRTTTDMANLPATIFTTLLDAINALMTNDEAPDAKKKPSTKTPTSSG